MYRTCLKSKSTIMATAPKSGSTQKIISTMDLPMFKIREFKTPNVSYAMRLSQPNQ